MIIIAKALFLVFCTVDYWFLRFARFFIRVKFMSFLLYQHKEVVAF